MDCLELDVSQADLHELGQVAAGVLGVFAHDMQPLIWNRIRSVLKAALNMEKNLGLMQGRVE